MNFDPGLPSDVMLNRCYTRIVPLLEMLMPYIDTGSSSETLPSSTSWRSTVEANDLLAFRDDGSDSGDVSVVTQSFESLLEFSNRRRRNERFFATAGYRSGDY